MLGGRPAGRLDISMYICDCLRSASVIDAPRIVLKLLSDIVPSAWLPSKISGWYGCSIGSPEIGTGAGNMPLSHPVSTVPSGGWYWRSSITWAWNKGHNSHCQECCETQTLSCLRLFFNRQYFFVQSESKFKNQNQKSSGLSLRLQILLRFSVWFSSSHACE